MAKNWPIWKRRLCGFAQVNGWRNILDGGITLEDYGMDGDEKFIRVKMQKSQDQNNFSSENSIHDDSNLILEELRANLNSKGAMNTFEDLKLSLNSKIENKAKPIKNLVIIDGLTRKEFIVGNSQLFYRMITTMDDLQLSEFVNVKDNDTVGL